MDWALYGYVARGCNRSAIVSALQQPMIISQVAKKSKISLSHVSRAMKDLEQKGVAECITPDEKSGRVYQLTKKGQEIREKMQAANRTDG